MLDNVVCAALQDMVGWMLQKGGLERLQGAASPGGKSSSSTNSGGTGSRGSSVGGRVGSPTPLLPNLKGAKR